MIDFIKSLYTKETILFLMVILTNFVISEIIVSQVIYGVIALFLFPRIVNIFFRSSYFRYFLYFFLFSFINYLLYHNTNALGSSLRFVSNLLICVIILVYYNNQKRSKVIEGYLTAVTFFSAFVIIQFVSYHLLGFNLNFDFGDYTGATNAANAYDPMDSLFYRTGGMFKEPSWYASFCTPCVFIMTQLRRYKMLAICLLGSVLSTSGVAFGVLFVYLLWLLKRLSFFQIALCAILMVALLGSFTYLMGHALGALDAENTRLQIYTHIYSKGIFTLFGVDSNSLYTDGVFTYFMNTLSFIYCIFGLIGLAVFIKFIFFSKLKMLTVAIIVVMAIEGLYGRIDFWMMILACRLFDIECHKIENRRGGLEKSYKKVI